MDLHAGSMVQHFEILKYCLPDLIQVLHRKNREGSPQRDLAVCTEPQLLALLPACIVYVVVTRNKFVQKAIYQSRGGGKVNSIIDTQAHRITVRQLSKVLKCYETFQHPRGKVLLVFHQFSTLQEFFAWALPGFTGQSINHRVLEVHS